MSNEQVGVLNRQEYRKPPQYVLVLHLNPTAYNLALHVEVQHVLEVHLGLGAADVEKAIKGAANSGMSVIKPVTKDIGESLMQQVNRCLVVQSSRNFKVALELL